MLRRERALANRESACHPWGAGHHQCYYMDEVKEPAKANTGYIKTP